MPKRTNAPRKAKAEAKPAEHTPQDAPKEPGKTEVILALLRRPEGATVEDLTEATGWQAHSVRGAISGTVKKKLQLQVASTKEGNTRVYRVVEAQG